MSALQGAAADSPTRAKLSARGNILVGWCFSAVALLLVALTLWGLKDFYFHARAHPNRKSAPPAASASRPRSGSMPSVNRSLGT
jgi:hypothetical protein